MNVSSVRRLSGLIALLAVLGMAACGGGGRGGSSEQVSVPTISITASPSSISASQSSTLTWSSTNATSCSASGGWSGSVQPSGGATVSPTATVAYTLACTGTGGIGSDSATIAVTGGVIPTDNSDCSTLYVRGRVLTLDGVDSGSLNQTFTDVRSFGADTTYAGQTVAQVIDQLPPSTSIEYIQEQPTEWIIFGFATLQAGQGSSQRYQPALHHPKQWTIGQSTTYSGQLLTGLPAADVTISSVTTLVRRESVTVPAGTFDTCLFHTDSITSNSAGTAQGSADTWIAPNVGEVKSVVTGPGITTTHTLRQFQ